MSEKNLRDNEPVTRGEFQEFVDFVVENVATKDDLKAFATKDDLKDFAKKVDLQKVEVRLDGVEYRLGSLENKIEHFEERVITKIDKVLDKLEDHDVRIVNLENKVGAR